MKKIINIIKDIRPIFFGYILIIALGILCINHFRYGLSMFDFIFVFTISIYFIAVIVVSEFYGEFKHKRFLKQQLIQELIAIGFHKNEKVSYRGLKGIHNTFHFDLYLDWNALINNKTQTSYTFQFYFKPIEEKTKLFENLNEKYSIERKKIASYVYEWENGVLIMKNLPIGLNLTFDNFINRMNMATKILIKEGFSELSNDEFTQFEKVKFYPRIKTFNTLEIKKY